MITRENYEIWMLDFAEGKLDPAQQKMLFAFLEQHPDLKKELENFEHLSFRNPHEEEMPTFNLRKKQSWLLEKYSPDELVFHYNEGNLNAEELREWNDLVKTMPQLLQQAEKEKRLVLKPSIEESFGEKVWLKRPEGAYQITIDNCSHYFIQYHETKELALRTAINTFLAQHPHLKEEFALYAKLVLEPDRSIVFGQKESLKKKEKEVVLYWWRYVAVAASVLLAVWFFYPADENKPILNAHHKGDSTRHQDPVIPGQNNVSPQQVIAKKNIIDQNNQEKKQQDLPGITVKENKHQKEEQNKKEQKPVLLDDHKAPGNIVKEEQHRQVKDSTHTPAPVLQKDEEAVAHNKNENKTSSNNIQTVETPKELVSAVLNKKYYEEQTPRQQTSNAFYAMRNVVHTVSGGEADVIKKEDKNSKEFSVRIGNFGFSRKKHKGNDE